MHHNIQMRITASKLRKMNQSSESFGKKKRNIMKKVFSFFPAAQTANDRERHRPTYAGTNAQS